MKLDRIVAISFLILTIGFVGCGGGTSGPVQPPPPPSPQPQPQPSSPVIGSISPKSAAAGSPDLTLTVTGTNFISGKTHKYNAVGWSANGSETLLSTTYVSGTQLTAIVPAALLSEPVTAQVRVEIWDNRAGGGDPPDSVSNWENFSVNSPVAATISPSSDTLGTNGMRQFVYVINGNSGNATWAVEEGAVGGSITSGGLYTASNTAGMYHIVATSVADSSMTATSLVSVVKSGFTVAGSMGKARSGHTATLLMNGKVLIAGGTAGPDSSAELFDPTSGTFAPTGSMTTPRVSATATLIADGKVLITGGYGPGVSMLPKLNSAELYDPQAGSFAVTGSMAIGRIKPTATLLDDGKVLITGGIVDGGGGGAATASTELYDPATGTFTLTGSMISARADHTATLLASGNVLIVGGWNGHRADAADDPPWDPLFAELFDPTSGSFAESGTMSTTRIGHSALRLADGKVLVLGGVPTIQNLHVELLDPAYAELYTPSARTFSAVNGFTLSRTAYSSTVLDSGKVLIAGGNEAGLAISSAELLDPATGISTSTGSLITDRAGHTATLLKDGRVLVVGGTDAKGNVLASAELYK
jgi:hypothetical protein